MKVIRPAIKWSGSKRSQAPLILEHFPKKIKTYYEPFVGGASVLRYLLESDIKVDNFICSDINKDLISLWNNIKLCPAIVTEHYKKLWIEMKDIGLGINKKKYYFNVRERFNENKSPLDFMFLTRTCFNGLSRYNKSGNFNASLHPNRDGIRPETLGKILNEWSMLINEKNVSFLYSHYGKITSEQNDFLYLDPPYANTKGMYYGQIGYDSFWDWLQEQKGNWALSFDGKAKDKDMTFDVPKDLYSGHFYLCSGNSSFRRLIKTSNDSIVYESLYTSIK